MATAVMSASPAHVVRDALFAIARVEQVFVSSSTDGGISVLTVVGDRDYAVQKQIFRTEAEIIHSLPGIEVGFELVIRDGRPLDQLISPRGTLLFAR